jgi:hypothetical protein
LVAVTLFHAHIWFNHLVYDKSDYAKQVWPFAIFHSLLALIAVWGFLSWPSIRQLYDVEGQDGQIRPASIGEENDRASEDRASA